MGSINSEGFFNIHFNRHGPAADAVIDYQRRARRKDAIL
jgi:hypothetical protein